MILTLLNNVIFEIFKLENFLKDSTILYRLTLIPFAIYNSYKYIRLTDVIKMLRRAYLDQKILVVDDDPVNTELMKRILGKNGYVNVETLIDSSLFWEVYEKYEPDLLILDLMMPIKNGYKILKEFQEKNKDQIIPIIIITAQDDQNSRMEALNLGVWDFIGKPFHYVDVLNKINNLLDIKGYR